MSRVAPLMSRLMGRAGWSQTLAQAASRSWEISPAVESLAPPALFDDADLDRVTGVAAEDTIDYAVARARGGRHRHTATVAHELRDCVLAGGHVFARRFLLQVGDHPLPRLAAARMPSLERATLVSSHYGLRHFGHWLIDDLPRAEAAREVGAPPVSTLVRPSGQQSRYLQALGIDAPVFADAHVDKLVILDDTGQNDYKRARYALLRERMRRAVTAPKTLRKRPVMLLRGATGLRRVLVNEIEVAATLQERGFVVLDPVHDSLDAVIAACLDAPMILGVEGSHLANGLMWMRPGGTVVTIQPPQRFCMYLKDRSDCEGMRYAFVVAHARNDDSFHVAPAQVHRLLDRLDAASV